MMPPFVHENSAWNLIWSKKNVFYSLGEVFFDTSLTLYYLHVHSNDLGTFIPPLKSRAIQPTITNIFYDQPLVDGNQLHYEDMESGIGSL
jgi:hypothetical protein